MGRIQSWESYSTCLFLPCTAEVSSASCDGWSVTKMIEETLFPNDTRKWRTKQGCTAFLKITMFL